jgi:hypothetical protein
MCTVLLPAGVNPIAVNKHTISYHILFIKQNFLKVCFDNLRISTIYIYMFIYLFIYLHFRVLVSRDVALCSGNLTNTESDRDVMPSLTRVFVSLKTPGDQNPQAQRWWNLSILQILSFSINTLSCTYTAHTAVLLRSGVHIAPYPVRYSTVICFGLIFSLSPATLFLSCDVRNNITI